jgi:hypothetical protein
LPGWVWDLHEFQWDEGFSALQRFTAREGHARPKGIHKEEGYNRLGQRDGAMIFYDLDKLGIDVDNLLGRK